MQPMSPNRANVEELACGVASMGLRTGDLDHPGFWPLSIEDEKTIPCEAAFDMRVEYAVQWSL